MKKAVLIILFTVILVLDQLTKYLADMNLELGVSLPVIPNFFNLTLVYNTGAAFGIFSDLSDTVRRISLYSVSFVALTIVLRFMFVEAKDDYVSKLALTSILAGACGNMIDRVRFDKVIDFLDFYYNTYHWPAFNVADIAICTGVFILVIRMVFTKKESVNNNLEAVTTVMK